MSDSGFSDAPLLVDLNDAEFQELARMVSGQFGIHLTEKKRALVRGRLNKVLRTRGLTSFAQYLDYVRRDATGLALVELVDRLSTNHTFFFREAEHFAFFEDVALPEIASGRSSEVRLWCAGCATGEEAYTLAMLCHDWAERTAFAGAFKILATDISVTALEAAFAGEYSDERVKLVPQILRRRYLAKIGPDRWAVAPELRAMILFKRLNFMDSRYPFRNLFHAIFCRNVMIYFDRETKNALVRRLTHYLAPGRYLFIGHSESLGREPFDLQYVRPSVYRRPLS